MVLLLSLKTKYPQGYSMTYVVTENCIKCKFTDCVDVCPVDCFYEGKNFLVINPDECIDCSLCVPACPAEAIYPDDEVPADQQEFTLLNATLSQQWPNINKMQTPAADAQQWNGKADKKALLIR